MIEDARMFEEMTPSHDSFPVFVFVFVSVLVSDFFHCCPITPLTSTQRVSSYILRSSSSCPRFLFCLSMCFSLATTLFSRYL